MHAKNLTTVLYFIRFHAQSCISKQKALINSCNVKLILTETDIVVHRNSHALLKICPYVPLNKCVYATGEKF